ncbi:MAG: carbon-nitrogen hydrolase family protein [Pseudomonadota bacterium]
MEAFKAAAGSARPADALTVALAQLAPVWGDRVATLAKVIDAVTQAAAEGAQLVCFGEALVPGYPFHVSVTDGARFDDAVQKALYAHYLDAGVVIERGDLEPLAQCAATHGIAVYLGCMERAPDRGGHSLYCSLVFIDAQGNVGSVHRKLQPTYEERLVWAAGDGHGLRTHALGPFTAGGLNCWENWLPLPRAALYGQGEDLHVAVWPGSDRNTRDITRFIALESRSYVLSVSSVMRLEDFPPELPHRDRLVAAGVDCFANGGSAIAGPDGQWVIEPQVDRELLLLATLDHAQVRQERQNLDVAGHYSRPDVTQLSVDRRRQSTVRLLDDAPGNARENA